VVQDLCPGARTAHGDLPSDPVTLALVGSALGTGPPTAPAAVRC
jgi:triacylglycerol lipase